MRGICPRLVARARKSPLTPLFQRGGRPTLLLLAALALASCGEPTSGSAPRIQFGETSFDAGRIEQGARVEHVFVFRNGGDRDLRVTRVRPSCDCTAAVSSDATIAPKGTAEIATSFDTSGLSGKVTRTISVFSNDPAAPATLLHLTADVDFDVAAEPRRLYVGRVHPGDEVRVQGRIVLDGGAQVTRIESSGPVVAAELVEPAAGSPPRNERRYRVRIAENAAAGEFTNEVTVHTTSRSTPMLAIPVVGVVEGKA